MVEDVHRVATVVDKAAPLTLPPTNLINTRHDRLRMGAVTLASGLGARQRGGVGATVHCDTVR